MREEYRQSFDTPSVTEIVDGMEAVTWERGKEGEDDREIDDQLLGDSGISVVSHKITQDATMVVWLNSICSVSLSITSSLAFLN